LLFYSAVDILFCIPSCPSVCVGKILNNYKIGIVLDNIAQMKSKIIIIQIVWGRLGKAKVFSRLVAFNTLVLYNVCKFRWIYFVFVCACINLNKQRRCCVYSFHKYSLNI
jgi:hypothetical protein